jgi:uncharacterized protein YcfJ
MKRKQMTGVIAGSLMLCTAGWAGQSALGDSRGDSRFEADGGQFDYAEVLSVDPLVRQVRVTVPNRECYTETRYVPVRGPVNRSAPAAGGMIVGGVLGAVVGSQLGRDIGGRDGRRNGALAGGIVGMAIGHDAAERRAVRSDAYGSYGSYGSAEVRPVETERCEVRNEEHMEERVDGYRVTWRYQGHTHTSRMNHDPGQQLRVRVSVDPVG